MGSHSDDCGGIVVGVGKVLEEEEEEEEEDGLPSLQRYTRHNIHTRTVCTISDHVSQRE